MVLVDTSIWLDHLRYNDDALFQLLEQGQVCIHSMIIGELACGHLQNREQLSSLWKNLPHASEVNHDEALFCLESNRLMGKGIGFVDLHLLASCLMTSGSLLWTKDRRLKAVA